MKITQKVVHVLTLDGSDLELLSRGEPLRFDFNGEYFELCREEKETPLQNRNGAGEKPEEAEASKPPPQPHRKPKEKPGKKVRARKKPSPETLEKLRREGKKLAENIVELEDRFCILYPSKVKTLMKSEYEKAVKALAGLPDKFSRADLRESTGLSMDKLQVLTSILKIKGKIRLEGQVFARQYVKTAGGEDKKAEAPEEDDKGQETPQPRESPMLHELLQLVVRKGEVWEDTLSPEERSLFSLMEQKGLVVRREAGYDCQPYYAPTTRGVEFLRKFENQAKRFMNGPGKIRAFLSVFKPGEKITASEVARRLQEEGYKVTVQEVRMFLRNNLLHKFLERGSAPGRKTLYWLDSAQALRRQVETAKKKKTGTGEVEKVAAD
jgi:hypothetical protein